MAPYQNVLVQVGKTWESWYEPIRLDYTWSADTLPAAATTIDPCFCPPAVLPSPPVKSVIDLYAMLNIEWRARKEWPCHGSFSSFRVPGDVQQQLLNPWTEPVALSSIQHFFTNSKFRSLHPPFFVPTLCRVSSVFIPMLSDVQGSTVICRLGTEFELLRHQDS